MGTSESRRRAAAARRRQIQSKASRFPPNGAPSMFVADVMLGRLAKWLRLAGFDVLYSNRYTDDELVSLSRQEGRILLSRDTRLLVRKQVDRFIFLESETIQSQIRQVLETTNTHNLPGALTRCLACNDLLETTLHERVRDLVPAYVFETQKQFKSCPSCGKIYWAGTHRESVLRAFEKILMQRNPKS
jgi:uncharacterized protein with PIN domain